MTRKEMEISLHEDFELVHDILDRIKSTVETTRDKEAIQLAEEIKIGAFGPMRRLRLLLGIPYYQRNSL